MPPIRRSLHATRTRVDPLRRNNQDKPRIPRVQVDGLVHGWQFKAQYEGSDVPEVRRTAALRWKHGFDVYVISFPVSQILAYLDLQILGFPH